MGIMFQGSIDDAIAQAKAAPSFEGSSKGSERRELLKFLRAEPSAPSLRHPAVQHAWDDVVTLLDRERLNNWIQAREDDAVLDALAAPSKFSLSWAIEHGYFPAIRPEPAVRS
jgi:hypothetical protein